MNSAAHKRTLSAALKRSLCALLLCGAVSDVASAGFLDTDFWCRTYGCAVVHDGTDYDIYDNWQFATNSCCVPVGTPMVSYYRRAETPNRTGTLTPITGLGPDGDESMMLGVTQGGTNASFSDNGNGYLDAGDSLSAFALNSATDIALDGPGRRYSHSFFISSRNTRFSLRALAQIAGASGDFANTIQLGDIKLTPQITATGTDGSFDFGSRANAGNIMIVSGVDDLGDLSGAPTQIMDFGTASGIRSRNGDIDQQSIRVDMLYSMPEYDLSMGIGSLNIDVIFDFYREP